ncbi:hypothetical protein VCHENC02_2151A, partial [Vibrio harveyi]
MDFNLRILEVDVFYVVWVYKFCCI